MWYPKNVSVLFQQQIHCQHAYPDRFNAMLALTFRTQLLTLPALHQIAETLRKFHSNAPASASFDLLGLFRRRPRSVCGVLRRCFRCFGSEAPAAAQPSLSPIYPHFFTTGTPSHSCSQGPSLPSALCPRTSRGHPTPQHSRPPLRHHHHQQQQLPRASHTYHSSLRYMMQRSVRYDGDADCCMAISRLGCMCNQSLRASTLDNQPTNLHDQQGAARMRTVGALAAGALHHAGRLVSPGVTTDSLDAAVHDYIVTRGGYPSPLRYGGFPKSVCTSVNECICHGVPDDR